jgi:Helix-turn-helix
VRPAAEQQARAGGPALRAADQTLDHRHAFDRIAARGAEAASWRPFQLAFVLLNLPPLTTPGHPERAGLVRAEQDRTQEEVARAMGVTQPRVSAVERGELDTVTLSTLGHTCERSAGHFASPQTSRTASTG